MRAFWKPCRLLAQGQGKTSPCDAISGAWASYGKKVRSLNQPQSLGLSSPTHVPRAARAMPCLSHENKAKNANHHINIKEDSHLRMKGLLLDCTRLCSLSEIDI